jgi:ABC-type phosphate transport system auxiliary subunit
MDDISTTLISRIDSLLGAPSKVDSADVRADMETTLTEGYARALALETEHLRIRRRIAAITAALADGKGEPQTTKLVELVRRLAASEEELAGLRETLAALRNRLALDAA